MGELSRRAPGAPLLWVGHSVGGQLLGLLPEAPVRAAVFLGSQSGWPGHWSGLSRAVMAALWWGVIPASTAVAGYLPMRALGQGEDVPADAYAPPAACQGLLALYRRARTELRVVRPADLGVGALGHFEPLRERFRDALWREVREWLLEAADHRKA